MYGRDLFAFYDDSHEQEPTPVPLAERLESVPTGFCGLQVGILAFLSMYDR